MTRTADELIGEASRAHYAGRLDDAIAHGRAALKLRPNDQQAMLIIGMAAAQKNEPAVAVPMLERILQIDPKSFDAPFWLSLVLRRQGQVPRALEMAKRAASLQPSNEHALNQVGLCHLDLHQGNDAVASFEKACALAPNFGPVFENLAKALRAMGRNKEAIVALRHALEIGPVRPQLLFQLGDAYMSEPLPEEAEKCARRILQIDPNSIPGNLLLARALIGEGRVAEGADYALRTMHLAPKNAVPVAYYGRALQSLGKIQEADEQFRRSIELEPHQGFAYHALVHNHRVTPDERPLVETMKELSGDPTLPPRELIQIEYGLGKALEDLGEFEAAMHHFDEANRIDHTLKVGVAPFDPDQLRATGSFLIQTFVPSFFERHRSAVSESDLPIFVVGMMRSGTTLAEQIISSHADVGGAGEQTFWPDHAGMGERLFDLSGGPSEAVLLEDRLRSLAADYVRLLQRIAPGKPRVVDKMNTNYLLLGLLHTAFPNARIVHMRRHPVDTCLSIWATPVANQVDLCGKKENVVIAYEQYLRIMAHWREVLPENRFLDVQYEELCSDREPVTRRILEFLGLPWDDACMAPEKNDRSVKTPSVWQVRQPVYKTSMERWRRYEPWLGEFAKLFAYS